MKIKMKTDDDDVNVNLGAFVCKAVLQPHTFEFPSVL